MDGIIPCEKRNQRGKPSVVRTAQCTARGPLRLRAAPTCPAFYAVLVAVLIAATCAYGAVGDIFSRSDRGRGEQAAPDPLETVPIDELVAVCEQSAQDARAQLDEARKSEEAQLPLQLGASPEEISERTLLLQDLVRALEQQLKALRRIKSVRDSATVLQEEMTAWDGFPDRAAVTIDLVDSLRDAIDLRNQDIRAAEAERSLLSRTLSTRQTALSAAEQRALRAEEDLSTNRAPAQAPYLIWLRDLAALRLRKAQAELEQTRTEKRALDESIAHHTKARAFLETQFQVAAAQSPFSKEALDIKLAAVAEMRAKVERDLEEARKAHTAAVKALDDARAKLTEARQAEAGPDEEPDTRARRIEALQDVVNEREAVAETAQFKVEVLEMLRELNESLETVWRQRFDTRRAIELSLDNRFDAIDRARNFIEATRGKLIHPRFDLETAARRIRALVGSLEERLAIWQPEFGDKARAERMLDTYYERGELCRTGLTRISDVDRLLQRWENEVAQYAAAQSWSDWLGRLARNAHKWGGQIWRMELFRAGDASITIDKIALTLIILIIGSILARRVASRIRQVTMERFHVEEGVAAPLEAGVFYTLIVFVILFALSAVRIPLTVFAYLGGALAIGVGFGAQNLIGNFISGLIMLFERPIKIGDIVEVDGVFGTVRNIGGRCSRVRRFDGIDMLIPNSAFLEKNVVNWTLADRRVRFKISVGVAYGSPTRKVEHLILQAVEEHPGVLESPAPVVVFEEFGDSALIFSVYIWLDLGASLDSRIVRSDIRHRIDELFREAHITISFPQRDIHLDVQRPIPVDVVKNREDHEDQEHGRDSRASPDS